MKKTAKMNNENILQNLERIADSLNIKIIYDEFKKDDYKTKSSSCLVKGEPQIIIDKSLKLKDKIEIILNELSSYDLDNIYMAPHIRELFKREKGEGD
jgi:hypothetical protein